LIHALRSPAMGEGQLGVGGRMSPTNKTGSGMKRCGSAPLAAADAAAAAI
jgi:hypothetical protein